MHKYATFIIKNELAPSKTLETSHYRIACDNRVFEVASNNFTENFDVRLGDSTLSVEVRTRLQNVLSSNEWGMNKVMAKWGAKDCIDKEAGWCVSENSSTDGGLSSQQMSRILSCHLSKGDEVDVDTTLSFIELVGEIKKTFTSPAIVRIDSDGDAFKAVQLYCVS